MVRYRFVSFADIKQETLSKLKNSQGQGQFMSIYDKKRAETGDKVKNTFHVSFGKFLERWVGLTRK